MLHATQELCIPQRDTSSAMQSSFALRLGLVGGACLVVGVGMVSYKTIPSRFSNSVFSEPR